MCGPTGTAPAAAANCTRDYCTGSPNVATDKPSQASPNRMRPATVFTGPSDFKMSGYTGGPNGSTTAGTTSHGCNSTCSALPTRMGRPAPSSDTPGSATRSGHDSHEWTPGGFRGQSAHVGDHSARTTHRCVVGGRSVVSNPVDRAGHQP